MKLILILTTLMFVTSPYAKESEAMIFGYGTSTCGLFVQAMDSSKSKEIPANQWMSGYLSGLNAATKSKVAENLDYYARSFWIYNYCKDNPTENLATAGMTFYNDHINK
jgi:hypothetical protein